MIIDLFQSVALVALGVCVLTQLRVNHDLTKRIENLEVRFGVRPQMHRWRK